MMSEGLATVLEGNTGGTIQMAKPTENGEVGVAREFSRFVFLRVVIVLSLCWAVVGSWSFGYILDYFGLGGWSIELKWSLFVGVSLVGIIIATFLLIGATKIALRICRSPQRN